MGICGPKEGGISVERKNVCQPPEYTMDDFSEFFEREKARALRLNEIEAIIGEDYDLDRLRDLVEADRDGRCEVLPCKPGDTINAFRLGDKKKLCVISDMVTSVTTNKYGWTIKTKSKFLPIKEADGNKIARISQYPYALVDYYVGPREAAEAALRDQNGGTV